MDFLKEFTTNSYILDVGICEHYFHPQICFYKGEFEGQWGNLLWATWGASCEGNLINFSKFLVVRERFWWGPTFHFTQNWRLWQRKEVSSVFKLLLACSWLCVHKLGVCWGIRALGSSGGDQALPGPRDLCPEENPAGGQYRTAWSQAIGVRIRIHFLSWRSRSTPRLSFPQVQPIDFDYIRYELINLKTHGMWTDVFCYFW